MSIFTTIAEKIFHSHTNEASASPSASQAHFVPTLSGTTQPGAPDLSAKTVDPSAVLQGLAAKSSEKLNWKESIVDMMKLLGMDSSLSARTTLAKELKYSGDTSDTAKMNVWLSKEVMTKLASNGGKMPSSIA